MHSYGLGRPMTTPIVFVDSLGPKHLRKSLQWYCRCPRNFFGAFWSPMGHLQKCNFESICLKIAPKRPLKPKNHLKDAFGAVECDGDVVWPSRLLSWITMILTTFARTYNVIETHFKKFSWHFKVSPHIFKGLSSCHFWPQMGIKS